MNMKYVDEKQLNDYQRGIYQVAEKLMKAFRWKDAPQGFDYWEQVHDNLIDLIEANKALGVR